MYTYKQDEVVKLLSGLIKNQQQFKWLPLKDRFWIIQNPETATLLLTLILEERNLIENEIMPNSIYEWKEKETRQVIRNGLKIPEVMGILVSHQRMIDIQSSEQLQSATKKIKDTIKLYISAIRNRNVFARDDIRSKFKRKSFFYYAGHFKDH